jgi:hypothetical protein
MTFLLASMPFQLFELAAQVGPTQEDQAETEYMAPAIYASAGRTAKKIAMNFQHLQRSNGALHKLSLNVAKATIEAASTMSLKAMSATIANLMAYLPSYSWVFTVANICHNFYARANHVKQRDYTFVAQTAGHYQLKVWVPGDWLRPRSMVKVITMGANETLQYSYDQENSSDRTETIEIDLPAGLTQISVSVGSGTLLTHTAGHLEQATLDNGYAPVPAA